MALGITGIIKPATVDLTDVEVLYSYTPDRITKPDNFKRIASTSDVLEKRFINGNSTTALQGMYLMKMSTTIFNKVGFYTIMIRPKQINATILDCGILSQLPDQKGIVFDTNEQNVADLGSKLGPGGLCGFRIEYLNPDRTIINNLFTTVAYSNRCEAITQQASTTTQRSVVYRFNDQGSLLFLSVTPSTSPSIKPNALPFIGVAGQKVIISNTYFDPQVIDIELTEYDLKKIALLVNGERTLNVETGIENIYDDNRNILAQSTLFDIKDEFQNPLYKVKQNNTSINEAETWDTINDGVEII
jgi:hypothetical protein